MIKLEQFINALTPGMGDPNANKNPELAEAVGLALKKAMNSNWRDIATRRMVVIVTDSPAYKTEQSSILKDAKQFASSGDSNSISTVFVATHNRKDAEFDSKTMTRLRNNSIQASEFLTKLAMAGSGQAIDSGDSMTSDLLHAILF